MRYIIENGFSKFRNARTSSTPSIIYHADNSAAPRIELRFVPDPPNTICSMTCRCLADDRQSQRKFAIQDIIMSESTLRNILKPRSSEEFD